jgi:hypothetical protein
MSTIAPDGPRPTFLGIGSGKCGTSWIWEMLRRHPDLFLPELKEIHYFNEEAPEAHNVPNPRSRRPIEWYLSYFSDAEPRRVCGEITPSYLWSRSAPRRIHAFDPSMKLFVSFRDPVDRLFSVYLFGIQRGQTDSSLSFEETLEQAPYLIERTKYGASIARYLDLFPREQLHVILYEDIRDEPDRVLTDLARFIGVDPFVPEDAGEAANITGRPVHPGVTRRLMQLRLVTKRYGLERVIEAADRLGLGAAYRHLRRSEPFDDRPTIAPETEARLRELFAPDIELLESQLDLDLTAWKPEAVTAQLLP